MKPLIAANWKMYKTSKEAVGFLKELKKLVSDVKDMDIVVCGPFTALESMGKALPKNVSLGAENMFWEKEGAYTGEVSPLMLKDIGCEYVILGHSERRKYFKETDDMINKKLKSALQYQLKPILCVGETFEERKAGRTNDVVETQLKNGLAGITKDDMKSITLAYEPIWAISGGDPTHKPATAKDAQEMHEFVRGTIARLYDRQTADSARIIYGGSMKPDNVSELMSMKDINGGLIGGASLDPKSFAQLVKFKKQ